MSSVIQVAAAVLVKSGHLIIARRAPGDPLADKWELPGGKLEAGELPEQCLVRELQEECNLIVSVGDYVGRNTHCYDHMTIELLVYRASWVSGEPTPLVHAECRWVTTGELKYYDFAPADMPFIRKLENGDIDIRSTPATR